jgi:CheY-like chemotaxis protein
MPDPIHRSIFALVQSNDDEVAFLPSVDDVVDSVTARTKVLVVDDQRLIADTLAEILTNSGFEAVPAHDGWEALEIAARFRPDWLLSDVLMPRMNGVELAIAVRQKYPLTSVLLFSGQAGISEILEEGQQRGYVFDLIAKPIHPLRLIERLKAN